MEEEGNNKKPLYCHWDSHEQDVLFMDENELDQHIYSHFKCFPQSADPSNYEESMSLTPESPITTPVKQENDSKENHTVECHWDACHEMFDIDEMMQHFRTNHLDVSQHPHDANCMREIKQCLMESPKSSFSEQKYDYSQPHCHVPGMNHISQPQEFPGNRPSYYESMNYQPVPGFENLPPSLQFLMQPMPQQSPQEVSPQTSNAGQVSQQQLSQQISDSLLQEQKKDVNPVKIDISSLPTLNSSVNTSSSEFPAQTCMWLTPNGVCGEQFFTNNELNAHIVHKHINEPGCSSCKWDGCRRENLPFNQRQKMIRHMQIHARTTEHICNICNQSMSSDAMLKTHELRHLNEWPHKCETCGRCFRTKSALSVHIRTHTGAKPLVCNFPGCGKRFAESSNLAKHRRTHMEPQFMCPVCMRRFTRKDHLRRHMKTKDHFDPNPEKKVTDSAIQATNPVVEPSQSL